jgi:hypothetical protein
VVDEYAAIVRMESFDYKGEMIDKALEFKKKIAYKYDIVLDNRTFPIRQSATISCASTITYLQLI